MKKIVPFLVCVLLLVSVPFTASAYSAHSMVLLEHTTHTVVDSVNCNDRLPMASTTKIMTALVTVNSLPLDKKITVPSAACGIEGSSIYLVAGEVLTVEQLLYGLMLASGNDAATALAIAVAGSVDAFVGMMNETATEMGLKDTHFTNPSGLPDDGHYTTAFELALIASAALDNPTLAKIVGTKSVRIPYKNNDNGRLVTNHNKLLSMYEYAVGMKTGFTKSAGRCLVSAAVKDGVTLLCVTLNAPDDWNDHISAFEYGFSKTKYQCLAEKGDIALSLSTPDGKTVCATNMQAVYSVTFSGAEISQKFYAERFVYAPKAVGQSVATVCFYSNGTPVASAPLCLTQSVEVHIEKQFFITKLLNYIKGLFAF